eukprot:2486108-Prymnesium_polylepis.1
MRALSVANDCSGCVATITSYGLTAGLALVCTAYSGRALAISRRNMPGALQRLWKSVRWGTVPLVALQVLKIAAHSVEGRHGNDAGDGALEADVAALVVWTACFWASSPSHRERARRWVAAYVVRGEAKSAATIATLVSKVEGKQAMAFAGETFMGIRFDKLVQADFTSSEDTGLKRRAVNVALGKVDAFLSHSWHDDPAEKWKALQGWAAAFRHANARQPLLWVDKACVNQQDIASSITMLPIYLSGCRRLLVIAGPTYVSRVWCMMELFTWVKMGGDMHRVTIIPISADNASLAQQFREFDVRHAQCFTPEEKDALTKIIADGFGGYHVFNRMMRVVFGQRILKSRGDDVEEMKAHEKEVAGFMSRKAGQVAQAISLDDM